MRVLTLRLVNGVPILDVFGIVNTSFAERVEVHTGWKLEEDYCLRERWHAKSATTGSSHT
jgi:hypothetical protein